MVTCAMGDGRDGICLNVGECSRESRNPGSSKGFGSHGTGEGKGSGKSTSELLHRLQELNTEIAAYVQKSGRGRRPDGTWGHGSQASNAIALRVGLTQFADRCIAPGCNWDRPQDLFRCEFCQAKICSWHHCWVGGRCHCALADQAGCQEQARQQFPSDASARAP